MGSGGDELWDGKEIEYRENRKLSYFSDSYQPKPSISFLRKSDREDREGGRAV